MFKFVNWLLVFTAGYWSLSIACMFLLFEDFGDPEPGSTGPQPDLAYGTPTSRRQSTSTSSRSKSLSR